METVERCEQLYCVDGHTFDQVASVTGVARSTLQRWAQTYGWAEKREQIRHALASIRTNTVLLRARLIENCLTTLHSQDAFAVSAIESMVQRASRDAARSDAQRPVQPETLREIHTDEDALMAIEEAVQIRINQMLANPGQVTLSAMKEIRSVLSLLSEMRAKVRPSDVASAAGGLSADAADEIRRKILGLVK